MTTPALEGTDRRSAVLDAALQTFARFGYRKTSMEDVARAAEISRPGLYFLFESKGGLFRAAAERAVELDLATAERALGSDAPLDDRLVAAFDAWAGRYVGPLRDTATLIEANPELVGPTAIAGPARFAEVVASAIERSGRFREPAVVARTLLSTSIGCKHQTTDRAEYREWMRDAVRLLTGTDAP